MVIPTLHQLTFMTKQEGAQGALQVHLFAQGSISGDGTVVNDCRVTGRRRRYRRADDVVLFRLRLGCQVDQQIAVLVIHVRKCRCRRRSGRGR